MRTEPPGQRLARRLGAGRETAEPQSDPESEDDTDARALLPRWLPDGVPARGDRWLAGLRADPGRSGAIGLAVIAAIAVLVTVFTLVRSSPTPVVSAKLPPVQPVATSSREAAPAPAAEGPVVVSVVGLVVTPGLVTLPPGARVADAVSAAGGAMAGADNIGLNLARRLADGEQVVVGIVAPPGGPAALGSSVGGAKAPGAAADSPAGGAAAPSGPLDLNTATAEQLDGLPGLGPVTAAAIVAWRDRNGAFASVDQLGDVDGIGPARLEKLRALVRV